MSLGNIAFKEDLLGDEVVRKVVIAEEEANVAPEFSLQLAYLDRGSLRKMTKTAAKKTEATDDDENKFRRNVVLKAFRGWKGMCFATLCRLSDKCFVNALGLRQQLIGMGYPDMDSEIEFSLENAYWVAEMLNGEVFGKAIDGCTDQEAYFVLRKKELEKNS